MVRTIASGLVVALLLAGQALAANADTTLNGLVQTLDGKPVPGAKISVTSYRQALSNLTGSYWPTPFTATGDAAGRFVLVLPEGANSPVMTVEITAASRLHLVSYSVTPDLFDIFAMPQGKVEMTLVAKEGAGVMMGSVADEAGKPAAGAEVVIQRTFNHPRTNGAAVIESIRTSTGADGVYRFEHLPSGDYSTATVTPARGSGLVRLAGWRGVGSTTVIRAVPAKLDFTLVPGGRIRGRVVDEAGKPVAGAKVRANLAPATIEGPSTYQRAGNFDDETTTAKDGAYVLEGLSPETYSVSATGPDGSTFAPSGVLTGLRVKTNKTLAAQDLALIPGGTLKGKVTGADGKPVAGAIVAYAGQWVLTDVDGKYRFSNLATGAAKLAFLPPAGSAWAPREIDSVACVAKLDVVKNVALETGGVVTGTVTGIDGKSVAGAKVTACLMNARYEATSGRDGKFRIVGLAENKGLDYQGKPAVYTLAVQPPDDTFYVQGSATFSIKPGQTWTEDLTLEMGASVRIKVTTQDGKPVAGACVSVYSDLGSGARSFYAGGMQGIGPQLRTGADGTIVVRHLQQGARSISAEPPAGANLLYAETAGVNLVAGETAEGTVVLRPGGAIRGSVVDEKGKPVPEAQVSLQAQDARRMGWGQMPKPVVTDDGGRYEFQGLPSGGYAIEVHIFDGKSVVEPGQAGVVEGKDAEARHVAVTGGFIEIALKGPDGKPFESAIIYASRKGPDGKPIGSFYPRLDKSKVYVLGPVLPGDYDVSITPWGADRKPLKKMEVKGVTVKSGERARREVQLEELPVPAQPAVEGGNTGVPPGAEKPHDAPPQGGPKEEVFIR